MEITTRGRAETDTFEWGLLPFRGSPWVSSLGPHHNEAPLSQPPPLSPVSGTEGGLSQGRLGLVYPVGVKTRWLRVQGWQIILDTPGKTRTTSPRAALQAAPFSAESKQARPGETKGVN